MMIRFIALAWIALLLANDIAIAADPLGTRIQAFVTKQGKAVDLSAHRPLATMEDQADGKGAYIAKFDASLGPAPTTKDGFTAYELHRLKK